jgi:hypothetical protein
MVHFSDDDFSNSGVVKVVDNSQNTNLVIALDTLTFPESVKFIKIDVEGFEKSSFEGMINLIHRDKPMIWLEDISHTAVDFLKMNNYVMLESQPESRDYLMVYNL